MYMYMYMYMYGNIHSCAQTHLYSQSHILYGRKLLVACEKLICYETQKMHAKKSAIYSIQWMDRWMFTMNLLLYLTSFYLLLVNVFPWQLQLLQLSSNIASPGSHLFSRVTTSKCRFIDIISTEKQIKNQRIGKAILQRKRIQ